MRRRNFLQYLAPLGAGLLGGQELLARTTDPAMKLGPNPPYLKPGDMLGITCPAGSIEPKDARYTEVMVAKWGFKTRVGSTVGKHWQRFAGTDMERAADFQRMIDDPYIRAIIFGRGGYGVIRMMDYINWDNFKKHPKWLVGFSDITALHCHVNRNFSIPTIHARMAGGFNAVEDESEISLRDILSGKQVDYRWKAHPLNRAGKATGMLVGGNLSMIYAMQASQSELDTTQKILFLEDVSEYKYTIDRMLMNLKRSGKLHNLAGLIIGGFTGIKEEEVDGFFSMSLEEIILEKVKEFSCPVSFGFPAGHQKPNLAIKLGMHYTLFTGIGESNLTEITDPHPALPLQPYLDSIAPPPADSIIQIP
jgi:muramoyltetrapeptide carboxypeptidase